MQLQPRDNKKNEKPTHFWDKSNLMIHLFFPQDFLEKKSIHLNEVSSCFWESGDHLLGLDFSSKLGMEFWGGQPTNNICQVLNSSPTWEITYKNKGYLYGNAISANFAKKNSMAPQSKSLNFWYDVSIYSFQVYRSSLANGSCCSTLRLPFLWGMFISWKTSRHNHLMSGLLVQVEVPTSECTLLSQK